MAQVQQYRPDIDGLRAVAVMSVIAFHAVPGLLPGGFVGVDIFFVISGYLITRQIRLELQAGTFRLARFFARRIRRIYPALVLVVTVCMFGGWFVLLPSEFAALGRHAAAAMASVANLVFLSEIGYFAPAATTQPLLHLWSLGVEEQFYVLFALLLALAWRLRPIGATWMLAGITLLSLAACIGLSVRNPNEAFFLPWTRAWQFAVGGLLAMCEPLARAEAGGRPYSETSTAPVTTAELAGWAGAALLVLSLTGMSEAGYPGSAALSPTVAAALTIAAGPQAWVNRRVLSLGPIVTIGLVSYSLYLWHWPLLVFPSLAGWYEPSTAAVAASVAASFIAAALTYRLVEKPARRQGARTVVAMVYVAGLVGVTGHYAALAWVPARSSGSDLAITIDDARGDWKFESITQPFDNQGDVAWSVGAGPHHVLIVGDSNAHQYAPRVDELVTSKVAQGAVFAGVNGCAPVRGLVRTDEGANDCRQAIERVMALADRESFSTVLVAAQWAGYFTHPRYVFRTAGERVATRDAAGAELALVSLRESLVAWRRAGKQVYLVLAMPTGAPFDPAVAIRHALQHRGNGMDEARGVARNGELDRIASINERLRQAAREAGVHVIDPFASLCDLASCRALDDGGRPIYRDSAHLRADFVRTGIRYLDQALAR